MLGDKEALGAGAGVERLRATWLSGPGEGREQGHTETTGLAQPVIQGRTAPRTGRKVWAEEAFNPQVRGQHVQPPPAFRNQAPQEHRVPCGAL